MEKSSGASAATIILGVILAFLIISGLGVAGSYVSANNRANAFEQTLKAQKENSESILAQYGQKTQEAAQVPGMMADDLVKVTSAAIEGRYGKDGSKAIFQMLKEQNPQIDPKLYEKIQQIVESGRNEFQSSQAIMIDTKRAYETALGSFWSGMWMRIAGYPRVNLADFKAITTDRAQAAFATGKESSPIKLR